MKRGKRERLTRLIARLEAELVDAVDHHFYRKRYVQESGEERIVNALHKHNDTLPDNHHAVLRLAHKLEIQRIQRRLEEARRGLLNLKTKSKPQQNKKTK